MIPEANDVPIAAPAVRNAGIGPSPRIRITFSTIFEQRDRHAEHHRCASVSRRPQRAGEHEEDHLPHARREDDAEEGECLGLHGRRRIHEIEQPRRQEIADRRDDRRQPDRRDERLINRAVHPFLVARAGETRDEHTHPEKSDEMNITTTRNICQLTPIAAFPA